MDSTVDCRQPRSRRSGLKSLLAGTGIKVIAEATSGQQAVTYALQHDVDTVLMDVRMPDGDGLTALGRIKLEKPDLPILMFSSFDNPVYIARAVALGASGYLLKGCSRDELVSAIKAAAAPNWVGRVDTLKSSSRCSNRIVIRPS